ncbi:MAG: hypothetical protein QME60_07130 [Verrucomicrobiota bacterium]|nr:hypothetical protein [Verrucomicrobiota bacterium]
MKKLAALVVFCVVALVAASVVVAEEVKATELSGAVAVVKDDAGAVTSVSITTAAKETVAVKLDDEGKKLAAMEKKQVRVTGTVEGEEGQKTATVQKAVVVEKVE